ncbi:MAG: cytidine deaminase [Selenomonadaceae bacterium]|nr:cytidine deaminase [Selenomonadaceae bacterium]
MLNEEIIDTMVRTAIDAIKNAYVEHTSLEVGACALTSDGTLYSGCNIDNASPKAYCTAEELAMYKAISDGKRDFDAVAVIADTEKPFVPAGSSLQLMAEFQVQDVIMANMDGELEIVSLDELFPTGAKVRENRRLTMVE